MPTPAIITLNISQAIKHKSNWQTELLAKNSNTGNSMYFPKYNISNSKGTSPDTNPHLTYIHSFNIKPLWSTFISTVIIIIIIIFFNIININNVSLCWQQSHRNCRSNARCSSTISSSWIVNLDGVYIVIDAAWRAARRQKWRSTESTLTS